MILKNECISIRKSLTSVSPIVDEIVVFDTGSTDGTQDICREFEKVRMIEAPCPLFMTEAEDGFDRIHFSRARNEVQSHAKGDWIFILDGDEIVTQTDGLHHYIEMLEEKDFESAFVEVKSYDEGGQGNFLQIRLHQNNDAIEWKWPVHNALVGFKGASSEIPLEISTSYAKKDRVGKLDRSEPMLRKAYVEYPEETWPAYYLAGHYLGEREAEKAKVWARRALEKDPKDIKVARAWYWLIHATLMTEGLDEAEKLLYQGLVFHPNYPDLNWVRTIYALARWEVIMGGESSHQYLSVPQKSYQINKEAIAKQLLIKWPFVKVRVTEQEEPSNGKQPSIGT
jgi:glycosyltransferase involved in cell wall biosynthesis